MSMLISSISDRAIGYPVIDIATGREDLLCWTRGKHRAKIAEKARENKITYVPVLESNRITGLITSDSLNSKKRPRIIPLTSDWLIAADTPILKLIELFAERTDRIFLVLQASDIVGLVAPEDLNKTPARASIYLLLAEFETMLGNLIRTVLPDEEMYRGYLSDCRRKELDNQREKRRKKLVKQRGGAEDNDSSPLDSMYTALPLLDSMYITDLTTIAAKDPQLCELLGFSSATNADNKMKVTEIRDQVSHPVGPLIASRDNLQKLQERCRRLLDLNERVKCAHARLRAASG